MLESEAIGGQAGTTSLIRNYLGFPRGISGRELASRALRYTWPRFSSQVTLLVRGPSLSGRMSAYLIDELERASNISVWLNTVITRVDGRGRLETISLQDSRTGRVWTEPAEGLFVLIGADPHSD